MASRLARLEETRRQRPKKADGTIDAPSSSAAPGRLFIDGVVIMHLIAFLIFGLIVGALARLIVPGKEPGGWGISLLLGVAGSFLGGFIGRALGLYRNGETGGFFVSLLGAIILVGAYHAFMRRRTTTGTPGNWRPGRT